MRPGTDRPWLVPTIRVNNEEANFEEATKRHPCRQNAFSPTNFHSFLALPALLQVIFLVWGCELCAVILLHCHISQLLSLILFGQQILIRASGPLSGNEIRAYSWSSDPLFWDIIFSDAVSCYDNHRAGADDRVYDFEDLPSLIFFRHRISKFSAYYTFALNHRAGAVDRVYDFEDLPSLTFFRHRISNFRHILHLRRPISRWFHGDSALNTFLIIFRIVHNSIIESFSFSFVEIRI